MTFKFSLVECEVPNATGYKKRIKAIDVFVVERSIVNKLCFEMADPKLYRRDEVEKNNSNQSAWIIIHNSVYSVTEFLNEVSVRTNYRQ
jgi:cytochrome b involved in lipid metabolism